MTTDEESRQEAIDIFTKAWEATNERIKESGESAPKGTRVGAGIDALIGAGFIRVGN